MLFENEAYIRDYQVIGATWFLRANKESPDEGPHAAAILMGTVAPATR